MRYGFKLALALTLSALALCQQASAGPAILFDANSGAVIYSEDVDQVWHPASLTKLMTAYVTFKALKEGKLKPDQKLTVGENGFKAPPSKLGLKVGDTIDADLAIKAMVVKSANDMAVTIAETLGGSEAGFAELMNAEAKRLGMKKSHYANASGLPHEGQLTSARDLALLTKALITDFPDQAYLFSMASVKVGGKDVETHNTLLKTYDGADGMKTGFICDSGYNIVASATRDGHRLVAVVLGEQSSASRNVRAAAMLDFGFQNYLWRTLFNPSTVETVEGAPTDTAIPGKLRDQVSSCVAHDAAKAKAVQRAKLRAEKRTAGKAGKDAKAVKTDPAVKDPKAAKDGKAAKAAKVDTAVPAVKDPKAAKAGAKTPVVLKPTAAATPPVQDSAAN
jgi:D-alanyl-D-alanine carboxypeptidase